MSLCYHSFQKDPNRAKSEIIAAVNEVYAPDMVFNTIEEIQEYFEYVHLESQEIKFIQTTTAIKTYNMEPIITVNQYPIGWEWLDRVPLEDFNWLIEIFSILTDDTDTYDFVGYTDSETLPGQQKVCSVDKIPLANFLNDYQGYESGISMYGHYIACKCLDISSEREYMNRYTDIRILTNELKSC